MDRYKFSMSQLGEAFHSAVLGNIKPTEILMSPQTLFQLKRWMQWELSRTYSDEELDNCYLYGAEIKEAHIPDGQIAFVGGATVLKLEINNGD